MKNKLLRLVVFFQLVMIFGAVVYLIGWWSIDVRNFIKVNTIVVQDASAGTLPKVSVGREVLSHFDGGYRVVLRRADIAHTVCSSGLITVPYKPRDDPITKDVLWWSAGGSCTKDMFLRQPPGLYSLESSHCVRRFWIYPYKCHTWLPYTTFRLLPPASQISPDE